MPTLQLEKLNYKCEVQRPVTNKENSEITHRSKNFQILAFFEDHACQLKKKKKVFYSAKYKILLIHSTDHPFIH